MILKILPEPFLGPGNRGGGFQLPELCRDTFVPPEVGVPGSAENVLHDYFTPKM